VYHNPIYKSDAYSFLQNLSIQRTSPVLSIASQQQVRERHSKHYEPKWRKLRAQKVIKVTAC